MNGQRPRISVGFGLTLFAAWACFSLGLREPVFLNLFWQIPDGIAIASGHAPVRVPTAIESGPLVAQEWLFEVVLGWLVQHGAYVAFLILCAAAAGFLPLLCYWLARRAGVDSFASGMTALFTIGSVFAASTLRAETFALDLFALVLLVVSGAGSVLWLVPIVALWANLHASVLLALVAALVFALSATVYGTWIERRRSWSCVALVSASTLLTPLGTGLWSYAFTLAFGGSPARQYLDVWSPLSFTQPAALSVVLPGLLVFAAFGIAVRRESLAGVALALVVLFATLAHHRYATFLIVAWFVPLARTLGERTALRRWLLRDLRLSPATLAPLVVGVAIFVAQAAHAKPDSEGPWQTAAAIAREHGLSGNAFTEYGWAAYLGYRGLPLRVLIDAHGDPYPAAVWNDARMLERLGPRWREVLDRRKIDVVIIDERDSLAQALAQRADWQRVEQRSGVVAYRRAPS